MSQSMRAQALGPQREVQRIDRLGRLAWDITWAMLATGGACVALTLGLFALNGWRSETMMLVLDLSGIAIALLSLVPISACVLLAFREPRLERRRREAERQARLLGELPWPDTSIRALATSIRAERERIQAQQEQ